MGHLDKSRRRVSGEVSAEVSFPRLSRRRLGVAEQGTGGSLELVPCGAKLGRRVRSVHGLAITTEAPKSSKPFLSSARTVRPQLLDAPILVWGVCPFPAALHVGDNDHGAESLVQRPCCSGHERLRSPVAPRGPSEPPWYERYWLKIFVFPGSAKTFHITSSAA